MDEFDLIATYLRPLTRSFPGSLNLNDDAAILSLPPGQELVITKDAISQGVHFIGNESPALIAQKLLRVNLSDLAAMGATPLCYFLALMLPPLTPPPAGSTEGVREAWIKDFVEGLRQDQKEFGIALAGGDTISMKGPLSFSVTALGTVPAGHALRRGGAKEGDTIYVSGTLGDSALGLALLQKNLEFRMNGDDMLAQRYLLPQPRLTLGQKLIGIASACMDISDGLVQDLEHLCDASGVGAVIKRHRLPLSEAVSVRLHKDKSVWDAVLAGGDDYELLFTAPSEQRQKLTELAAELPISITEIGHITRNVGVKALDEKGNGIPLLHKGFHHAL